MTKFYISTLKFETIAKCRRFFSPFSVPPYALLIHIKHINLCLSNGIIQSKLFANSNNPHTNKSIPMQKIFIPELHWPSARCLWRATKVLYQHLERCNNNTFAVFSSIWGLYSIPVFFCADGFSRHSALHKTRKIYIIIVRDEEKKTTLETLQ